MYMCMHAERWDRSAPQDGTIRVWDVNHYKILSVAKCQTFTAGVPLCMVFTGEVTFSGWKDGKWVFVPHGRKDVGGWKNHSPSHSLPPPPFRIFLEASSLSSTIRSLTS